MSKTYILWLPYFDCSLKRRLGRRVALSVCIENPRAEEFLEVCRRLNIECEYLDKKYPRVWYRQYGCIIAKNVVLKKSELIKIMAREVKTLRSHAKSTTRDH